MAIFRSAFVRELCSIAVIVGLTTIMLNPALCGDWPVGHDHPVHLVRIAQLKQSVIDEGTPWGWSHHWFAGYPENVTYPIGADLFVLAVQVLSLGKLTLTAAYGVAFWLFYVLHGYGTFYFRLRVMHPRPHRLWFSGVWGANPTKSCV